MIRNWEIEHNRQGFTMQPTRHLEEYRREIIDQLFDGSGRGFVDWVCETHSNLIAHSHRLSNILIRLDGDRDVGKILVGGWGRRDQEDPSYAALHEDLAVSAGQEG